MRPRAVAASPRRGVACLLLAIGLGGATTAVFAPHGALADDAAGQLPDVACPDPLVVHRPEGSVGDEAAVAITTQVVERGVPGWASVGWQAARATTLTAILVTTPDGVERRPGDASGVASGVLELTFCGTHEPATADGPRTDDTEERTAAIRFDGDRGQAVDTTTASLLGAAVGLTAGAVVLLMSRSARRDREARR